MWEILPKLLAGGAAGAAITVVYLYTAGVVVPGHVYRAILDDRERERQRAEKAEQRIFDTVPALDRAYSQVARVPHVAKEIVTTAAAAVTDNGGGPKSRDSRK